MRVSRSTARSLVWFALVGQVVFVASWIVAGALQPDYSHLDSGVSVLGGRHEAHPWIANAGLVLLGLSLAALGVALLAVLPRRQAAVVACLLFCGAGVALVLTGAFRVDCDLSTEAHCNHLWHAGRLSWQTDAHLWLSLVCGWLLTLTPFAIARALWPGPVAPLAIALGVEGLAIGTASFVLDGVHGVPDGLVQRIDLAALHLWVLIVAVGVLYATRCEPKPGTIVPLRPRDFFARSWRGEGELWLRPFFLWRRLGNRFEARRESTWISDRVWRIDDQSLFGDGRIQRRQTFCEFVDDDRIRLTAGDLPEGADVWLDEDGYRMSPFRMDFPIGPLQLPVRCHDVSRVESDGTLVNTFDARSLVGGFLIGRLTFRVRPVDRPQAVTASSANR